MTNINESSSLNFFKNSPLTVFCGHIWNKVNSVFPDGDNESFALRTVLNNSKFFHHKTKFGELMSNLIGIHEVEGNAPKNITKNNIGAQWCAYTVSHALELSVGKDKLKKFGIDFSKSPLFKKSSLGTWAAVSEYVAWAQKSQITDSNGHVKARYNNITQANVSKATMTNDRATREKQIRAQLTNNDPMTKIKEGDLIIWNGSYACHTDEGIKTLRSSHIGMIEKISQDKNGEFYVWVIEGNANEPLSDKNFERYINKTDSSVGSQKAGEIVELNQCDGIIRKCYTVKDLANFGYSGYINMSGIVRE